MRLSLPATSKRFCSTATAIGLVLTCLLLTGGPAAQEASPEIRDRRGDMVSVFSGDIHIPEGTRLRGTVVCVGGDVLIEGEVTQDTIVVLGNLEVSGRIGGEVVSVLSDQQLEDASISGDMISVLGSLNLVRSRVSGELVNILSEFDSDETSSFRGPQSRIGLPWFPSIWSLLFWGRLVFKLLVFVLVLLLVALAPDRIRAIGEEAPVRYLPAFFVGILGYLGLCIVLSLLSITLIGLPLALVAFYILRWLGIAGIFYAVGRRVGRAFGREMSVLGAVLLTFGLYVVVSLAPSPLGPLGWGLSAVFWLLFFLFVDLPAVGLIILTRVGGPRRPTEPIPPLPASSVPVVGPVSAPAVEPGDSSAGPG